MAVYSGAATIGFVLRACLKKCMGRTNPGSKRTLRFAETK